MYKMAPTKEKMSEQKLPENMSLDSDQQKQFLSDLKKTKKRVADTSDGPGVLYVGHIPNGFFEPQMARYFSQFGKVRKLRLSRSKKSGKQKGYAFVQFASTAVAKVVAESMNNYLMFNRLLKCEVVPPEKVHPDTFKGCRKPFSTPKSHLLAKRRHNQPQSNEQMTRAIKKMKRRHNKNQQKLAALGITVDIPEDIFNLPLVSSEKLSDDQTSEDEDEEMAPAAKKVKRDKSPSSPQKGKSPKKAVDKPSSKTRKVTSNSTVEDVPYDEESTPPAKKSKLGQEHSSARKQGKESKIKKETALKEVKASTFDEASFSSGEEDEECETLPLKKKPKQTKSPSPGKKGKGAKTGMEKAITSRTPKTPKTSKFKEKNDSVKKSKTPKIELLSGETPKSVKSSGFSEGDCTPSTKKSKLTNTPSSQIKMDKTPKSEKKVKTPKQDKLSCMDTPKAHTPSAKKGQSAKKKNAKK